MNPSKNQVCENCGHLIEDHNPYCSKCCGLVVINTGKYQSYCPAHLLAPSETPEDHQTIKEGMERLNEPAEKGKISHRMYCAKSGMRCLVYHADGICPDVRDCEGCAAERVQPRLLTKEDGEFLKSKSEPRAEGWEKEFNKISPIGNKDDNEYIKEFISSLLSQTEKEAEARGYEKGFTHGSEWKKSREEEIRKAYERGKSDGVREHDAKYHPINGKFQMENCHEAVSQALTAYREKVVEAIEKVPAYQTRSDGSWKLGNEQKHPLTVKEEILSAINNISLDQSHETK